MLETTKKAKGTELKPLNPMTEGGNLGEVALKYFMLLHKQVMSLGEEKHCDSLFLAACYP